MRATTMMLDAQQLVESRNTQTFVSAFSPHVYKFPVTVSVWRNLPKKQKTAVINLVQDLPAWHKDGGGLMSRQGEAKVREGTKGTSSKEGEWLFYLTYDLTWYRMSTMTMT
jgi:hypothetical protein